MNRLIRRYLHKDISMDRMTQADCDQIAAKLNQRLRLRFNLQAPVELDVSKR